MHLDPISSQSVTVGPRGTVLFADLRGYTAMAERLTPIYLATLLEQFFNRLTVEIEGHGGRVFHTAGDSLMAGFGLTDGKCDGSEEALAAARTILTQFDSLAEQWHREAEIETGLGIGLHLGEVALAVFGPPERRVMTLVGDTANVAARLCARARAGEVLFSCTVAAALQARAQAQAPATPRVEASANAFLQLPRYELRGRRAPLDIWCLPVLARTAPVVLASPPWETPGVERWQ